MLLVLQLNNLLGDAPTLVPVPDVVGQSQASATAELEAVLFVVAVVTANSSTVPAGDVISQSPLAGVEAVEGSTVTITVSLGEAVAQDASGGWAFFFRYEQAREARRRKKRELEEMEEAQKAIEDKQSREIAELLRIQEEKDAERSDLERVQQLADRFASDPVKVPTRVRTAIYQAHEQRTRNALERMQREIERMYEEEEAALLAALMMDDD